MYNRDIQCKVENCHLDLVVGHPGVVHWALEVVHRMINSCALGIKSWCSLFSCTLDLQEYRLGTVRL